MPNSHKEADLLQRIRDAEAKGLLPRPSERRTPPGSCVVLLIFSIVWGLIAFAAGIALGAPPPFEPGPGYDICTTKGC